MPTGVCVRSEKKYDGPEAILYLKNPKCLKRILMRGDIGLGESFINEDWDTPDLFSFLSLCALNADNMGRFANGSIVQKIIWRFVNSVIRRNTKTGSRKNIMAHYDVGNDFYSQWLDKSLTYSSALFENEQMSLEDAQNMKYQRILDQLPKDAHTILEIGCGWGGFAEYAALKGKKVTGITISPAQYAYAKKRLGNKANIHLCDYRDIKEKYDAVVSIEMFEAVGEAFWAGYFKTIYACLKPNGKAVIQSITVRDDLFNAYRKRNDFIRFYTFPGGMLPSAQKFQKYAHEALLTTEDTFFFGKDYKKTLLLWLKKLNTLNTLHLEKGKHFVKSWQFYMALCAAGFDCGRINVAQFTLVKN